MTGRRLTPANDRVAHVSLKGRVAAARFVEGEAASIAVPLVDLLAAPGGADSQFAPSSRAGHYMFDLQAYILARLDGAGVEAAATGHCTYGDEVSFFSYRRATHRNEPDYGRQISVIKLG